MDASQVRDDWIYPVAKRLLDGTAAILGLIVLSPVLVAIALAVKADSPGPVFYRGVRSGLHGKTFRIFKFRTMIVGADKLAGTTSRNDLRVTRTGKMLRRHKLDELPQLLNVLRSEMSLVGPRPELPMYTSRYEGEERMILEVKPGITDFASIEFSNLNDLIDDDDPDGSFEENILAEKNRLRLRYVRERGFLLDLVIIFKTIARVLRLH